MPAQHKYNKYDNKKRHSSSSSSSHHRKDKDHKNYHNEKWRKKSRSRSHSNHKHENKYKGTYQSSKDERRYNNTKQYDNKRSDSYRRREVQDDRRRNDDKKNVTRYTFTRNDDRDRGYQQYRKEQKKQKTLQSKRYVSSSSKSISKSPKHNRDSTRHNQSKFTYNKRSENKSSNFQDKAEKKEIEQSKYKYNFKEKQDYKEQKGENYYKEAEAQKSGKYGDNKVQRDNEERFYPKPKFGTMRPPFPPPPPNTRKFQEDPPKKFQFQSRKDEYKRQQKQFIPKQQKRKEEREQRVEPKREIIQKTIIQPQIPKLTPLRRLNEVKKQLKNEIIMAEIPKQKVSRFEMVMNEARVNLVLPNAPINFMTVDTFKNMNKFQIETLDRRWANSLKQELQKPRDLKQLLDSLPEVTQQQKSESKLWTYLKQQRNEQQHNLKMKLDELRLINMGLSQMVKKLHLLES